MKRKLNVRLITLITLICALVCAVIAGFALINNGKNSEIEDSGKTAETTEISAPDRKAEATAAPDRKLISFTQKVFSTTYSTTTQYLNDAIIGDSSWYTFCDQPTLPSGFDMEDDGDGYEDIKIDGGVDAGTYTITISLMYNYRYSHMLTSSGGTEISFTITINKATVSCSLDVPSTTYSTKQQSVSAAFHMVTGAGWKYCGLSLPRGWDTEDWDDDGYYVTIIIPAGTNAGKYTFTTSIRSEYATNYQLYGGKSSDTYQFTIDKASISPSLSYGTVTYGSNSGTPTLSGNTGSGGVTYSVKAGTGGATINSSTGVLTPSKAGTVTVTATIEATTNYLGGTATATVTIGGRNASNLTIDAIPDQTYTGSPLTPAIVVKDGTTTLTKDIDYSVSYSKNTNVANDATVTVTGKGNYTGTKTDTFKIIKAGQTPSISPSGTSNIAYGGTLQLTGTGYGAFTWKSSNTSVATVSDTGVVTAKAIGSATITLEAAGDDNHNKGTATKTVTVIKANQTVGITPAGDANLTCGSTLQLTGSGYGTKTWKSSNASVATVSDTGLVTAKAVGSVTITLEAAGDTNHEKGSTTKKITVTIGTQSAVTITPSATSVDYKGTVTLTASGGSEGAYTWSAKTQASGGTATLSATAGTSVTLTATHVGTVRVTLYRAATTNYNKSAEKTVDITINKATPTATASVTSGTYYIGNKLSTVGITKGTASTDGTFSWDSPNTILTSSGTYGWTFTPKDTTNYNNATGTLTVTAISPLDRIEVKNATTTYAAYEVFTKTGMIVTAYGGDSSKEVTSYTVTTPYDGRSGKYFLVSDDKCTVTISYTEAGTTKTYALTITVIKATYDMSKVSWTWATIFTYDGQPHSVSLQNLPTGVEAKYSGNSATNAGNYTASITGWTYDTANYNEPVFTPATCGWDIFRADVAQPTYTPSSVIYSETAQTITLSSVANMTVSLPSGWTISGAVITIPAKTGADVYSILVTPDDNHKWSSGTDVELSREIDVIIGKATYNMTGASWNYTSAFTYDGTGKTVTVQNLPKGVKVTAYSNNSKTDAGDYTAKVTEWEYDTTNYNAPTIADCNWTIAKATPQVTVSVNTDGVYYYVGDYINKIELSKDSSTIPGTVEWTYPTSQLTGKLVNYDWTFTPDSDHVNNYNTVSGKLLIEAVYKVVSIEVNLDKAKTDYTAFDKLDKNSIEITATYLMGKTPTKVTGWTFKYPTNGKDCFIVGDDGQDVIFSYEENGITVTCPLTVSVGKKAIDLDAMGVTMSNKTETYDPNKTYSIEIVGTLNEKLISAVSYTYTCNGTVVESAKNAGTYTVAAVFTLVDPDNYAMPKLSATLTIKKATQTITVTGNDTYSYSEGKLHGKYTGVTQTITGIASVDDDKQTVLYSNNTFTTVAEGNALKVKAYVAETENYNYNEVIVTLTVSKAQVKLEWTGGNGVYDGKEHNATLSVASGVFTRDASTFTTETLAEYVIVTYTTTDGNAARTQVGTYAPSYTGYPDAEPFCNYEPVLVKEDYTFAITQATVEGIEFTDGSFEYDDKLHTITITGILPDEVTVVYTLNGEEFTGVKNVGTYTVTAVFTCSVNYTPLGNKTAEIEITARAIADGDVSGIDSTYTYKGAKWEPDPLVQLTLKGADSPSTLVKDRDYTVTYKQDTEKGYTAGTKVTVTVTGTGNYTGEVTKTFTIEKSAITMTWEGETFTYNGKGQGITVNFTGIAESDKDTVVPVVKYKGRNGSSTEYAENEAMPVNAGNYTVTVYFVLNNDNYTTTIINEDFRNFVIDQAHVTVEVDVVGKYQPYAGSPLPAIDVKKPVYFGDTLVKGSLDWQKYGDVTPPLKVGSNDYVWVFTPIDSNFAQTTGTITISDVVMPDITGVTVAWKDNKQPDLYTSTTLEKIREYVVVHGIMGEGLGNPIEIADYELTGSWGAGHTPPKAESYTLTITVKSGDNTFVKPLTANYKEVILERITVTPANGFTKSYEAFATFDKSSIVVTAIYSDGEEVVVDDYDLTYPAGRDCFWASEAAQELTITYNKITEVIDGIKVSKKAYDLSALGIEQTISTTYDGTAKTYAINGEFGLGTVKYTYGRYDENGQFVQVASVVNAGTYVVKVEFTIEGKENEANYKAIAAQEVTLVINKATYDNVEAISFVQSSADYDLGNSIADKMKLQNVPEGVTVVYEYKDASGNVLTEEEVVNAGKYTVTATFVTDENHSGIAPMINKFTVNKAKPAVNPTVGGSLSKGTKLSQLVFADDGAVAGTFKWVNEEQELQAGVNRCYYTFTPEDGKNYETVRGYVDLSVGSLPEGGAATSAGSGNLNAGLTAAIIVGMAACLFVAVIALIIAARKPKAATDSDGFYDDITAEDLK